jgi:hypothetical protein
MGDLFGEVSVSVRELELWLYKVARLPHYSTKRAWYAKGWNIISKIQRAKASGELADIFGGEDCEFCGQLLCREQEDILSPICPIDELARLRRRVLVLELVLSAAIAPTARTPHERSPATAPASR